MSDTQGKASRGRVLVVDDSVVIRAIVGHTLRSAGFEVGEAEDGLAALRLLDRRAFDVVITDISMPGLDGMGVLSAVRERGLGTEVIILTGAQAHEMETAVRALRLGAHDFLTKPPAGPEVVVLTVDKAVEKKRLRDANAQLVDELRSLSARDALTGLLNRRSFDETRLQEEERTRRYGAPLSLLMMDLDHFKSINDTHGHKGGDEVLKSFASVARAVLRDTDLLFRYGGEEFAALLPETPTTGALDAANRLVAAVADTPLSAGCSRIRVTCSVGAASLEKDSPASYDLLAEADRALYEAKGSGRNRAVLAAARRATRRAAAKVSATLSRLSVQPGF